MQRSSHRNSLCQSLLPGHGLLSGCPEVSRSGPVLTALPPAPGMLLSGTGHSRTRLGSFLAAFPGPPAQATHTAHRVLCVGLSSVFPVPVEM